ncbi:hypothetical protein BHC47_09570 [Snodgrassella alvi]|uniref:Uncharacterized protein n=1 Tax=Snodgrassella alvi TaxID=1196083 RepID=A0A2N9Y7A8_9NEIS|nr:hypothetical protein BHC56_07175 [Snodgrassella alvi]PIT65066.1 hypothetical protein BHC47_09570 [Snodgrassella alvi]
MNRVNIMLNFSYLSNTDGSKPSLLLSDKSVELLNDALFYLEKKLEFILILMVQQKFILTIKKS